MFWTGLQYECSVCIPVSFFLWFAGEMTDNLNFQRSRNCRAKDFVVPFVQQFSDLEKKEQREFNCGTLAYTVPIPASKQSNYKQTRAIKYSKLCTLSLPSKCNM